jgi:hypothetical protein
MLKKNGVMIALAGLSIACLSSGCAKPRAVVNITSRGDQVKLVYYQQQFMGYDQGIVQCKAGDDGTLTDCKKLKIKFKE